MKTTSSYLFNSAIPAVLLASCLSFSSVGAAQSFNQVTTGAIVSDGGDSRSSNWSDYNNDGWLDLYVSNANAEDNFLYQNINGTTFQKITSGAFVNDGRWTSCAVWGDYNNDGNTDLYVSNGGAGVGASQLQNLFFRNDYPSGFFQIATGSMVTDQVKSGTCAWGDYDNDGFIDLFVINTDISNDLYKNNGNGTFTKILTGPVVNDIGSSRRAAWADYDNDRFLDLVVANFGGPNFVYHNNGDGTFTKITSGPIVQGSNSSIGVGWGDYNNDCYQDLFISNLNNEDNRLFTNNGDGTFTEVTTGAIVNDAGHSQACQWGDFDNDGWMDLFVSNSWFTNPTNTHNWLYMNNGNGTFTRVDTASTYTDSDWSIAATATDINNDGFLDLFVANRTGNNNDLFFNRGNQNHWVRVGLNGIISNKAAIGARIKVKAVIGGVPTWQLREVKSINGGDSQAGDFVYFGLGNATNIDSLSVYWPSGLVCHYENLAVDSFYMYNEVCCPFPYFLGNDTSFCQGSNLTLDAGFGFTDYLWNDNSTAQTLVINQPGEYHVSVTDASGCTVSDTVQVTMDNLPVAILTGDTIICIGDEVILDASASSGSSFLWNDGSTSSTNIYNQAAIAWVEVTNPCGTDRDSLNLTSLECTCIIHIPNAFSPDNNGINDVFKPEYQCTFTSFHMDVFNRWGELIYSTDNADNGWDGTFKGKDQNVGVYVWMIKYAYVEGTGSVSDTRSGNVTLLR